MRLSLPVLAAISIPIAFTGCNKTSSSSASSGPPLTVTATVVTGVIPAVTNGVKADGANTVTINVIGSTKAPITLLTQRGTFGGSKTATINATSGSATLTVCDSRTDSSCLGPVVVSALDANYATGSVTLDFIGFETICNDGIDNNGDGRTDCADPDCDQKVCASNGVAGTCQKLSCVVPACVPTSPTETNCMNGIDDDCNGKTDCADPACNNQPCSQTSATSICQNSTCVDVASGLGLTAAAPRARLPADGATTMTVTAKVTQNGSVAASFPVTFTTNLGAFVVGNPPYPTTANATTGADGTATVTFQAPASAGVATIRAFLTKIPALSQVVTVTMPALGGINLGALPEPMLGVKSSGWNESEVVTFNVVDVNNQPYPDGLAVRIEHQQLGNSEISTPQTADTATCLASAHCIGYQSATASPVGKPDSAGQAVVSLFSGTLAGYATLTATATAAGQTYTQSAVIPVIGAKLSGAHFAVDCNPKNLPALAFVRTCLETFYDATISCNAYLADRFNNVLGRGTTVSFDSEAGAAGPPVTTPQFVPNQANAGIGIATDTVSVTGYGLPKDVAPLPGEPSTTLANPDTCGVLTYNPRDGLVTIIAMARGEEGFVDLNGNGQYDLGEPFIDIGEPFVDENDNGIWDPGEPFVDVNGNGQYDPPNGVWDSDTVIWTETRVLYSGVPSVMSASPHNLSPSSETNPKQVEQSQLCYQDHNFNMIAPSQTTWAAVSDFPGVYDTVAIAQNPPSVDELGMTFTRVFSNELPGVAGATFAGTCEWAPCYIVPKFGGYANDISCGFITVTAVAPGFDVVGMYPTISGVTFETSPSVNVNVQ